MSNYYGDIPVDCTYKELVEIMTNGVKNFRRERELNIKRGWFTSRPRDLTEYDEIHFIVTYWTSDGYGSLDENEKLFNRIVDTEKLVNDVISCLYDK